MNHHVMKLKLMNTNQEKVHTHQDFELFYILSGTCNMIVNNKKYYLAEEDMILVNSNEEHKVEKPEDAIVVVFLISYKDICSFTKNPMIIFTCNTRLYPDISYDEFRLLLKHTLTYHMYSGCLEKMKEFSNYYQILWYLIKHFSVWNSYEEEPGEESRERLEYIIEYAQMNYHKQISLQDLSEQLYLSVPYLSKYIKKKLGVGLTDFVSSIRLYHAVSDLTHTNHSVTRIAFDNGFPNITSFHRVFKQEYQMTPTEYRAQAVEREQKISPKNIQEGSLKTLQTYFLSHPIKNIEDSKVHQIICNGDGNTRTPFIKHWQNILSLGSAEDLLKSDVRDHISLLNQQLKFKYGRIWNLFCHETCIDIHATGPYNFSKVHEVLDYLVVNNIIPFIDLGFKPKKITKNTTLNVYTESRPLGSISYDYFKSLMISFMKSCISRYGIEIVEQWKFEFWWNQEDIFQCHMNDEWKRLFEMIYQIIKKYVPKAMIGGFGFNTCDDYQRIENFLSSLSRQSVKPDFLSIYLYPYDMNQKENTSNALVFHQDFIKETILSVKKILEKYNYPADRLYITEWNMSISSRNYLHDSCYKGAYIMKNLIQTVGEVDYMGYWGSTDRQDEYFDSLYFLNGSPGLLGKSGVRKPAYYAFDFLNRLGNNIIEKEEHYILTSNHHHGYEIACHNYKSIGSEYYYQYNEDIPYQKVNSLFREDELKISFEIQNSRKGRYLIKKYYVNQEEGSAFDEWIKLGYVENLEQEETKYLANISIPHLITEVCHIKGNVLKFQTVLKPNEIQFIQITYEDE